MKSLDSLFMPRSIAVVGASRDRDGIGNKVVRYLISSKFPGRIFPINPKADQIEGLNAFPLTSSVGESIDLAVIAVPAPLVKIVIEDCHKAKIPTLVVITAGFAETGKKGSTAEKELVALLRGYGMRMVGPNCFGVINTDKDHPMNASFSPAFPPAGRVAMASQSGALGIAALNFARDFQLGLSKFVSLGNKADISSNDLLEYWEKDPLTDLILLYLESFGNPQKFSKLARRISAHKPIIALKSGRSSAGHRAAGSHTAALAASDVAVEALFRQARVLRAETMEEMFQLALAISSQPLPEGKRVAIVTNAGGPAILCTDACEASGLEVNELSSSLQTLLQSSLPYAASLKNPADLIAAGGPEDFGKAISCLLESPEVDALVVIYTVIDSEIPESFLPTVCRNLEEARKKGIKNKPVLLCLMEGKEERPPIMAGKERIPHFKFPEEPARLLGQMWHYAKLRKAQQDSSVITFSEKASSLMKSVVSASGSQWLSANETRELLKLSGIMLPPAAIATSAKSAAKAANEVGFPVALKLVSQTLTHKTEVGGVKLNLGNAQEVEAAFSAIQSSAKAKDPSAFEGVLIQPMIKGSVEIFIGMTRDPLFGPLIGFGLGGIHVEVLSDIRFRLAPITRTDAREMIREIRGYKLLQGYRGQTASDLEALEECLMRISSLSLAFPEILSLDLNPVMTLEPGKGYLVVDARIERRTV